MRLSELVIISHTRDGGSIRANLINCSLATDQQVEEFRCAFQGSGLNSVDAFLERRPEYMSIGKLAMAFVLIGYENHDRLFGFESNWLRTLYGRMATSYQELPKNRVAFITFNYDRNIEQA